MSDKQEMAQMVKTAPSDPIGMIHSSVESDERANREPSAPGAEEKKKILRARARELAREGEKGKKTGEFIEIVEFMLAYEKYGIESSYVREIHTVKELTPVPCTPPFVLGIINVRGQIVSVIDMKKFFELPERGLTDLNKVIIVHDDTMEFGILADSILGVRTIATEEIQPPLPTLTRIHAEYLRGVTKEPTVVLDAARILSSRNLRVHEEIII
jgi:purine-binding chemotaxis protein CheW